MHSRANNVLSVFSSLMIVTNELLLLFHADAELEILSLPPPTRKNLLPTRSVIFNAERESPERWQNNTILMMCEYRFVWRADFNGPSSDDQSETEKRFLQFRQNFCFLASVVVVVVPLERRIWSLTNTFARVLIKTKFGLNAIELVLQCRKEFPMLIGLSLSLPPLNASAMIDLLQIRIRFVATTDWPRFCSTTRKQKSIRNWTATSIVFFLLFCTSYLLLGLKRILQLIDHSPSLSLGQIDSSSLSLSFSLTRSRES